jgi:hypothetical protein
MYLEPRARRRICACLDAKAAECAVFGVLELERARGERLGPNSVEHTHALKNTDGFTFNIDRRPAFAQSRCNLDDRDLIAQAIQPESRRQTREARATDQHTGAGRRRNFSEGDRMGDHRGSSER